MSRQLLDGKCLTLYFDYFLAVNQIINIISFYYINYLLNFSIFFLYYGKKFLTNYACKQFKFQELETHSMDLGSFDSVKLTRSLVDSSRLYSKLKMIREIINS